MEKELEADPFFVHAGDGNCFILGVIYLLVNPLYLSTLIAGGIGIFLGGGGFLYYFFYPNTMRRRIRKPRKSLQLPEQLRRQPPVCRLPVGIVDNDNDVVKWTAVEDIEQTDTHVFILVRPKKAVIIPKRAFADNAAAERFVTNVRNIFQAAQKTS